MKEWNDFKVGRTEGERDCAQFDTVSHVSHVFPALEIVKNGKIKAGLVFDESKLNNKRILVSWLSPNDWSNGFRYGNVRFQFDLGSIVNDKRYYWVEFIPYRIKACRILITRNKHEDLEEYDPQNRDGPWWYDLENDTHYFNNEYCLEFMVEHDLDIKKAEIDVVNHHPERCAENRSNPKNCAQLGMLKQEAAALFVTSILGRDLPFRKSWLNSDATRVKGVSCVLYGAFSFLYRPLVDSHAASYGGSVKHTDSVSKALARSICNAYAIDRDDDVDKLRSFFKDKTHFEKSLAKAIAKHFSLSDYRSLL